ncbi:hypothetical protein CLAFUW4_04354 [Fulvia fulva]|uniref:2-dehydropantoate 2-reductase n=1 Tax=Passalora fulva TaxID=5499 RepID=A0A9Q8P8J0_PASFU|nr:uncharacterized protein CLAFUR5_04317 [Fulvia fulva]KAK4627062.1 hypothetical protein CLAFUR4_04340 [Fulvia fulva]KAK4628615.1 hypothetical protein CLAFUR0_04341 [Fulvia fulva]UJO17057.1 hypothetical protein CLAFUR5_04317 [Fulvia fulva]WPV13210.1 hypothetical protein CLAFUW4_04354 [Fulvia fulva]WPV29166.1 hypothetical protein CLAFUW7_04343 [Fulvia fulva]
MTTKVLFFGSGAVGAVYAYLLMKAGCEVTAVCRSNYDAVKKDGFHIDSERLGKGIHIKPLVVRTCDEADGPFDYVVVSCKAFPDANTSQTIAPAVTKGHTTIALFQNGIGIEEEYAAAFPSNPLLSVSVYLPTTQTSPGHIEMGNVEMLEIGPHPAPGASGYNSTAEASAEQLVRLFKSAGGNPHYYANIQERRWSKLLLNASWNPISALSLTRDLAFLASSSSSHDVIHGIMSEVKEIAQALGYTSVDEAAAEKSFNIVKVREGTSHPGVEPSMLVDILYGRRMEVEVILGNPVRIAKRLGFAVPRLEMLYALSKALDEATQHRKPGKSLETDDLKKQGASTT